MKHNLEKKFSTFDLALVLALIAVLLINILVSRSLPAPGMLCDCFSEEKREKRKERDGNKGY